MGKIIRAPEIWERDGAPGVFLAGGISNCPDWQEAVAHRIASTTNIDVINPRRYDWNMDSQSEESRKQIRWEYKQIHDCDFLLFWFCEETLCPITLFELGVAVSRRETLRGPDHIPLMVGIHPNYQRKLDVEEQVSLYAPNTPIFYNLEEMVEAFITSFVWP